MLYTDDTLNQSIDTVNNVVGLTEQERTKALSYLQGMVYMWCAINGNQVFAARDLMGGENYDWTGTPLVDVWYNRQRRYQAEYPDTPIEEINDWTHGEAAKEVGRLLKKVLIDDKRQFVELKGYSNQYQWVQ